MGRTASFYHKRDLAVLLALGSAMVFAFKANFIIGMPTSQFSGCLSQKIFLVSKNEHEVVHGGIYAVTLDRDVLIAKKGAKLLKIVAARGGDTVRVEDDGVWVNDKTFLAVPLQGIAGRLKVDLGTLKKTITVPPHQLYLVGNTDRSYDSRFWGTIDEKNVVGRAVAIW